MLHSCSGHSSRPSCQAWARLQQQRRASSCAAATSLPASSAPEAWRKAKPIAPGSEYPAKELCSGCGLCDTHYVGLVASACAFVGDGQGRQPALEAAVHGRSRSLANDEKYFGVHDRMVNIRAVQPVDGAQWTGVVTTVACAALRSGLVDAVACVGSSPNNPLVPRPFLALTEADVLSARGVKPCHSPSLNVLAEVEARGIKRLLFIGVGCAVQALRSVERHLGLEALYVMGTNCTDNGTAAGLNTFLNAVSVDPTTVSGYEFAVDYTVHVKHTTGLYERIPYFSLPSDELRGVIAPSCTSCFDYTNALADLVVGYMGVAAAPGVEMGQHTQYATVRNARGSELLAAASHSLATSPTTSSGGRRPFVLETVLADDKAARGGARSPAPVWLGTLLAKTLTAIGPTGLEFARYSIEYHTVRNALFVRRGAARNALKGAAAHLPPFAAAIVNDYDASGAVAARLALKPGDPEPEAKDFSAAGAIASLLLLLLLVWAVLGSNFPGL